MWANTHISCTSVAHTRIVRTARRTLPLIHLPNGTDAKADGGGGGGGRYTRTATSTGADEPTHFGGVSHYTFLPVARTPPTCMHNIHSPGCWVAEPTAALPMISCRWVYGAVWGWERWGVGSGSSRSTETWVIHILLIHPIWYVCRREVAILEACIARRGDKTHLCRAGRAPPKPILSTTPPFGVNAYRKTLHEFSHIRATENLHTRA